MSFFELQANPDRLISAVASIGYDPEVAICDLIDNSVSAESTEIKFFLENKEGIDEDNNGTDRYVISDNGYGMDEEGLKRAFDLGTDRKYPSGSLGKFGLGLKSAGLSLGNKLIFISKKKDNSHYTAILDRTTIREKNKYGVMISKSTDADIVLWKSYISEESPNGSVLIIDQLNDNQPSLNKFQEYMQEYIGMIYHRFISKGLSFYINKKLVTAFDPLFTKEADINGGLEHDDFAIWDGKTPKWLLKNAELAIPNAANITIKIQATQLIYPPAFHQDNVKMRKTYGIGSNEYNKQLRNGFYVYRNERIIGIAERFYGIVSPGSDSWAFRGSIMFSENADELLELDVKKRHIRLSVQLRNNLKNTIGKYISLSQLAWNTIAEKIKIEKEEKATTISSKEIGTSPIADTSFKPSQDKSIENSEDVREERQKEVAESSLSNITDSKINLEVLKESAEKRDVVKFSEGMKGNILWLPYPSTEENVIQAIINKSNSWISTAYNVAESKKDIVAIEILNSLLYILARADSEIRTNFHDIEVDIVEKIMNRFRRLVATLSEEYADKLEERFKADYEPEDSY